MIHTRFKIYFKSSKQNFNCITSLLNTVIFSIRYFCDCRIIDTLLRTTALSDRCFTAKAPHRNTVKVHLSVASLREREDNLKWNEDWRLQLYRRATGVVVKEGAREGGGIQTPPHTELQGERGYIMSSLPFPPPPLGMSRRRCRWALVILRRCEEPWGVLHPCHVWGCHEVWELMAKGIRSTNS